MAGGENGQTLLHRTLLATAVGITDITVVAYFAEGYKVPPEKNTVPPKEPIFI